MVALCRESMENYCSTIGAEHMLMTQVLAKMFPNTSRQYPHKIKGVY